MLVSCLANASPSAWLVSPVCSQAFALEGSNFSERAAPTSDTASLPHRIGKRSNLFNWQYVKTVPSKGHTLRRKNRARIILQNASAYCDYSRASNANMLNMGESANTGHSRQSSGLPFAKSGLYVPTGQGSMVDEPSGQ